MDDLVNHPPHYKSGGLEAIDVIEAFDLGFRLGNAVKYILRAGKKEDRAQDLRKAAWYLQREIEKAGGEKAGRAATEDDGRGGVMKWIPVTESLPPHNHDVLVWVKWSTGCHWEKGYWEKGYWALDAPQTYADRITHWCEVEGPKT